MQSADSRLTTDWWWRLTNWRLQMITDEWLLTTADDYGWMIADDCRYCLSRSFLLCSLWTDRKENPASNNSSIVVHVSVAKETRLPSRYVATAASSSSIVEAFNIVPTRGIKKKLRVRLATDSVFLPQNLLLNRACVLQWMSSDSRKCRPRSLDLSFMIIFTFYSTLYIIS
jgi:hypothetical protein